MKNFKFDLNAKVAIYVPSTTDVNRPCDNPDTFSEHFEEVYALAVEIRDEMKQEAVTLEYNGQVKFV